MTENEVTLSSVDNIVDIVKDITTYQYIDDDARDESMEEIKAKFPTSTQEQVELLYKVRSVKRAVAQLETELKNTLAYEMQGKACLLYTSPSPRDLSTSRMPSSA